MQGMMEIWILVIVLAVFAGFFIFGGRARGARGGNCCAAVPPATADSPPKAPAQAGGRAGSGESVSAGQRH